MTDCCVHTQSQTYAFQSGTEFHTEIKGQIEVWLHFNTKSSPVWSSADILYICNWKSCKVDPVIKISKKTLTWGISWFSWKRLVEGKQAWSEEEAVGGYWRGPSEKLLCVVQMSSVLTPCTLILLHSHDPWGCLLWNTLSNRHQFLFPPRWQTLTESRKVVIPPAIKKCEKEQSKYRL